MEPCTQEEDSGTAAAEHSRILIHLQQGKAFVWSAGDARRIREQHGLVGKLVGALDSTNVSRAADEKESYAQFLHYSYEEQWKLALQEKKRTLEGLSERIAEGRSKRKRQRVEQEEEPMESSSQGPIKELLNLEQTFHLPKEAMMVQIPTARLGNEEKVDIQEVSSEWPYTGQKNHEARYKVFRDLWQKGYYLTSGGKFGGDFLVYPGDPMRFHAHYIAICFPQEEDIALSDIITAGRLGTNVKKTVLLCSSKQEGQVTYTSLQWSGLQ
ncbi:tRNA-splicing endonuclease subunit Sen34 isoform X2 [Rhinoderma darwinii]|uniref:tRNA-splicing endonuclease subunit Sen34 isoform X2 n=1 Tax=Rhinoderma darwinii TaxID=43563 RepID=UPI003F6778FA